MWEASGEKEEIKESSPFLKFLQLKVSNMPKHHILGYCVLNPIITDFVNYKGIGSAVSVYLCLKPGI